MEMGLKWKWEENCGVLVACKIERENAENEPPPPIFAQHEHEGGRRSEHISHSKGHHQRKANLFPECGIADAYQMQKKNLFKILLIYFSLRYTTS